MYLQICLYKILNYDRNKLIYVLEIKITEFKSLYEISVQLLKRNLHIYTYQSV